MKLKAYALVHLRQEYQPIIADRPWVSNSPDYRWYLLEAEVPDQDLIPHERVAAKAKPLTADEVEKFIPPPPAPERPRPVLMREGGGQRPLPARPVDLGARTLDPELNVCNGQPTCAAVHHRLDCYARTDNGS